MLVLDGEGSVHSVAFTPDGTQLVAGRHGGLIDVWTVPAGERVRTIGPLGDDVAACAVHPSGRCVFAAGGRLRVVSLAETPSVVEVPGVEHVRRVVVSPGGEWVVADAETLAWRQSTGFRSTPDGQLGRVWQGERNPFGQSAGGFINATHLVTVGGKRVVVRDAATGAEKSASSYGSHYANYRAVSPDGSRFAVMAYADLYVWDTTTWGKPAQLNSGSSRPFTSFAFHPAKPLLAAIQRRQTLVKFFDTTTWQPVAKFNWKIGPMCAVAFGPDGTLAAAGSEGGKVVVWDVDA